MHRRVSHEDVQGRIDDRLGDNSRQDDRKDHNYLSCEGLVVLEGEVGMGIAVDSRVPGFDIGLPHSEPSVPLGTVSGVPNFFLLKSEHHRVGDVQAADEGLVAGKADDSHVVVVECAAPDGVSHVHGRGAELEAKEGTLERSVPGLILNVPFGIIADGHG